MPKPSYDVMLGKLSQCQRDFATLASDEEWSGQVDVIIRKAVPIVIRQVADSARFVVVITFDLRSLRDPGAIRRALGSRSPNVLLRSRWSHTEALLVLAAEPMEYCQTLAPILENAGLHAALFYTTYSGNVQMDYDRAVHSYPTHHVGVKGENHAPQR